MSSLRRACLVEKWMEKKVNDKVITRGVEKKSNSRSSSSTTLLEEFDLQDALFFSSTTTTTTSTSSSPSETEFPDYPAPKQKDRANCFAPPRPKPIKTHSIESKYLKQLDNNKVLDNEDLTMSSSTTRSRAAHFYSNLKNLKQPISPGLRLTNFMNSLFAKEGKNSRKKGNNSIASTKQGNTKDDTRSYSYDYSSCSSASSFSRSCMTKNKKVQDEGVKRTVRFCPVSVIVDDESQPCGYKSLREEKGDRLLNSKFGRSLSKSYEELRKFNGLEKESDKLQQQKKLEEVALDLLSGYWDNRLSKSHDLCSKEKINEDLFELDHLSLIGNELPVYETTQFDN
uniref:Uncharacterized protein n=1 Tax=Chenopodium quinoa TaxID=63459 RepID=A0A803LB56_CHEQI